MKYIIAKITSILHDFAHIPWEDTPNFPNPPQRNSFINKLLVKRLGYIFQGPCLENRKKPVRVFSTIGMYNPSTYQSEQQPHGSSVFLLNIFTAERCVACRVALAVLRPPVMLSERSLVALAAASFGVVMGLILRKRPRIRIPKSILAGFFSQRIASM